MFGNRPDQKRRAQCGCRFDQPPAPDIDRARQRAWQPVGHQVEPLGRVREQSVRPWQSTGQIAQPFATAVHPSPERTGHARFLILHPCKQFEPDWNGHFRSSRGSGRALIRNKIDQGCVRLVPDSRNERNVRRSRGAGDNLFVEAPKVFNAATAARDDDQVRPGQSTPGRECVEPGNGARNFWRAIGALHRHRPDQHLAWEPVTQPVQNIANDGTGGRGDHADDLGQVGQGFLARRVKQPLGRQRLFALFQHRHQRAFARDGHFIDVQIVLRLPAKRGHAARDDNLQPFLWHHGKLRDLTFPCRAGQHVPVIFDVVIEVPRPCREHSAHLTAHADAAKRVFQRAFHRAGHFGDGVFGHVLPGNRVVDQIRHRASLALLSAQP